MVVIHVPGKLCRPLVAWLLLLLASAAPIPGYAGAAASQARIRAFVQTAFLYSPELEAGDSSLAAAGQQAIAAGKPLYNPSLELEAGRRTIEKNTYIAGLSQTLDLFGKRGASQALGQAQLNAAQAQRLALRQRIAADVLKALADYDGASHQADLAAASKKALQTFFDISQRLRKVGEVGDPDLSLARLALANAVRDHAVAMQNLADARRALALASRVPEPQWPALPVGLPPALHKPADEQKLNALVLNLPTVRRAQAQAQAAEKQAELARRQRRADPTVLLQGGTEEGDTLVGLNLSIPLNIRNGYKAEAKAAAYQASAEKFTATDVRNAARLRLVAALEGYREARAASERWNALAGGRIDQGIEVLERVYRSGDMEAATYLTQLREHLNARAAGVQLHTDAWNAWFEWLDASGRWRAWLTASQDATSLETFK